MTVSCIHYFSAEGLVRIECLGISHFLFTKLLFCCPTAFHPYFDCLIVSPDFAHAPTFPLPRTSYSPLIWGILIRVVHFHVCIQHRLFGRDIKVGILLRHGGMEA